MTEKFEVGDYVEVIPTNVEEIYGFKGIVVNIPRGDGDAWHIIKDDGQLVAVQRFEQILRITAKEQLVCTCGGAEDIKCRIATHNIGKVGHENETS